jgi:MYXO-CTERM domain-containing protein
VAAFEGEGTAGSIGAAVAGSGAQAAGTAAVGGGGAAGAAAGAAAPVQPPAAKPKSGGCTLRPGQSSRSWLLGLALAALALTRRRKRRG